MQFSIATIVAVAGLVAAQTANTIPQCALGCFVDAANASQCKTDDYACLCSPAKYGSFVASAGTCIVNSCGADVASNQVLPAAGRLCAAVVGGGGPASTVASVVSSARTSISSAAQSAASVAASVSSRVASASSARASASASASASRASVSAAISSRASQATAALTTGAVPGTRTVAVTNVVTSRNGTATATSTVTPVSVNGASVQGPIGIMAVLAVAAFAAL